MIQIQSSGIYTSIQDLGRKGCSSMGISVSGVMDSYAAKFANLVLNNNENDAIIEIAFGTSKFEFLEDAIICISGANFSPKIKAENIEMNIAIEIKKGDVLSFGKRENGVRTYIAILGGCLTESVLYSRSFFKGITKETVLKKGDKIPVCKTEIKVKNTRAKVKFKKEYLKSNSIEVYEGPEYELLSEFQKEELLKTKFTISSSNSRMGYILNERVDNNLSSMHSSGVLPGTVQLTPSGKLIVLMRDCQITGGYPRVLQLTEESINILSQKMTGESVFFKLKTFY